MTVLLVTGTDTGVGKTVVAAALAVCLSRTGRVAVFKVVQAGEPADSEEVRRLTGLTDVHEGARLLDPLNPATAARLRGVTLPTVAEQAATIRRLAAEHDTVIVEGAGGVYVGLDNRGHTLVDLASELAGQPARELAGQPAGESAGASAQAPAAVVVTRAGLGTLNHSMLTVEALRRARVPVAGLVIGSWPARPGLAERCNLADLPEVTGVPLLGRIPEGAGRLRPSAFQAAAGDWLTLPQS